MKRIRLIKVMGDDDEHEIAVLNIDEAQQKVLKDSFNGWPNAVIHATGVYFLEDWDAASAVYVFSSHIKVEGDSFTVPLYDKVEEPKAATPTG